MRCCFFRLKKMENRRRLVTLLIDGEAVGSDNTDLIIQGVFHPFL